MKKHFTLAEYNELLSTLEGFIARTTEFKDESFCRYRRQAMRTLENGYKLYLAANGD